MVVFDPDPAVDVFADEPVSTGNPLLDVGDVIVTLHLGVGTEAAQENVATGRRARFSRRSEKGRSSTR